jgi:hypothetical protein
MDIDIVARLHTLELLVTQLIAEQLQSAPDPREQARSAREQLASAVTRAPLGATTLDEEARLRTRVQEAVTEILDLALRRVVVITASVIEGRRRTRSSLPVHAMIAFQFSGSSSCRTRRCSDSASWCGVEELEQSKEISHGTLGYWPRVQRSFRSGGLQPEPAFYLDGL